MGVEPLRIPTIETDRLILRAHTIADFESYAEVWSDPKVAAFMGDGVPLTRNGCWTRLLQHAGVWHYMGFGFFAIENKSTGEFIGEAGFHELRRNLPPRTDGRMAASWILKASSQGRGFATEAMSAAIGWAEQKYPSSSMTCMIQPANLPSIKVAKRLGFVETARTNFRGSDNIIFERNH